MKNTEKMTLEQMRDACARLWVKKQYTVGPLELGLGIAEEAGEVAKAILLTQSEEYQPNGRAGEKDKDLAGEVGDLMTYIFHLCNRVGVIPRFDKLNDEGVL